MKYFWLCLLFPLLLTGKEISWDSEQDGFHAYISLSEDELILGDQLHMRVILTYPSSYSVETDAILNNLIWSVNPLKPYWKIDQQEILPIIHETETTHKVLINLTLSPLEVGKIHLSLLNIKFLSLSSQHIKELFTPVFEINVKGSFIALESLYSDLPLLSLQPEFPTNLDSENMSALSNSTQVHKQIIHNRETLQWYSFPWLFILLVGLGCSGWLFWSYFKPQPKLKAKDFQSLKEHTLHNLDQLHKKDLLQKGHYKEFYGELTGIIRNYLEEQFDLPITTRTTEEFLHDSNIQSLFSEETQYLLSKFLTQADQVKFASHQPKIEECNKALDYARAIIKIFP